MESSLCTHGYMKLPVFPFYSIIGWESMREVIFIHFFFKKFNKLVLLDKNEREVHVVGGDTLFMVDGI